MDRRRGNGHRVHARRKKFLDSRPRRATPLLDDGVTAIFILIDNAHEVSAIHLGINPRVVPAHATHAHNTTSDWLCRRCHARILLATPVAAVDIFLPLPSMGNGLRHG